MKTVAFTPSRLNSQRVPQKNISLLDGVPLVNYSLEIINQVDLIDDIVLFASEPSICNYIRKGIRYRYLERPSTLDTQEAKVQDLINGFLKLNDADIIVMFHITSPFIKKDTIIDCVDKVKNLGYSSAFTAFEANEKCWFKGIPLNHSIEQVNENGLKPVIVEHSLYVFRRALFESTEQRIAGNPYIKIIDNIEGHDIDTPEDFKIAELILKTGLIKHDQ